VRDEMARPSINRYILPEAQLKTQKMKEDFEKTILQFKNPEFRERPHDEYIVQKKKKNISLAMAPPTRELSLNKTNRKGALINQAI